ncbi:hypothetical protein [Streptomyces sp. NRRL S-118]|uniref:hypothetical protein n=1 Tax=Streptomyces sp. NRRL S-118 TaxID=1463881 RepID=UPI000AD5A234|nr:hypothetical protein [Streptomyces sp. NRRL S-118]
MQQYGLAPFGASETYEGDHEFGAGAPHEYPEAEAEFGAEAEEEHWEDLGAAESHALHESLPLSMESPLSEAEEEQLAAELLEIGSEAELEQFLGRMFRNVSRGVRGFLRSPVGRSLGGIVKNVARAALPAVGGALGSMVAPGIGTTIGTRLGTMAGRLFEVEAEGVDQEEYEFEVARRVVRLAATAAGNAALDRRPGAPQALAGDAVLSAARRYAPGVARRFRSFAQPAPWSWPAPAPGGAVLRAPGTGGGAAHRCCGPGAAPGGVPGGIAGGVPGAVPRAVPGAPVPTSRARSGRWVRQGRKIVLLGI